MMPWTGTSHFNFAQEMLPAKTQEALMELHDIDESKSLTGVFNTNSRPKHWDFPRGTMSTCDEMKYESIWCHDRVAVCI